MEIRFRYKMHIKKKFENFFLNNLNWYRNYNKHFEKFFLFVSEIINIIFYKRYLEIYKYMHKKEYKLSKVFSLLIIFFRIFIIII